MLVATGVPVLSGPKTSVTTNQRCVSPKSEDLNTARDQWMPNLNGRMELHVLGTGCFFVGA
jgi:hypothetical protein